MRRSVGLAPWWLLAAVTAALGCAPPAMLGFAHPDPAPRSGAELSVTAFGGGGWPFVYGGAGISGAWRIGETGLAASLWGGGSLHAPGLFGAHLEAATPLGEPPDPAAPAPGNRLFLLWGVGMSGLVDLIHATLESPSPHEVDLARIRLTPELTVGLASSPADGETGGFGGIRLGAGVNLDPLVEPRAFRTAHIDLAFGGGWRWRVDEATFLDLQLIPFLAVQPGPSDFGFYGGAHLAFAVAFDASTP